MFFMKLRPVLQLQNIDFRCISPVSFEALGENSLKEIEGIDYPVLPRDIYEAVDALSIWLIENEFVAVGILPGCDPISSRLPFILDKKVRCFARIPIMTRGAYVPAQMMAPHLNALVTVSHRIEDDMRQYGIPSEKMDVIYNGVEKVAYESLEAERVSDPVFRMIYAGRIENMQKNVFLLPKIVKRVIRHVPDAMMTIVGSGPDRSTLHARFERLGLAENVRILGGVNQNKLHEQYIRSHCLVFPTRYEGCPNVLLEAMAAGCVPVVSLIRDLTERIVRSGKDGFLVPMGNANAFSMAIIKLAEDRNLWHQMSDAAHLRIENDFSLKQMAENYAVFFKRMLNAEDMRPKPLRCDELLQMNATRFTWQSHVPAPIKNFARNWLERMKSL